MYLILCRLDSSQQGYCQFQWHYHLNLKTLKKHLNKTQTFKDEYDQFLKFTHPLIRLATMKLLSSLFRSPVYIFQWNSYGRFSHMKNPVLLFFRPYLSKGITYSALLPLGAAFTIIVTLHRAPVPYSILMLLKEFLPLPE